MTKTNKKFMALAAAAVLGTAGVAWAAISAGLVTDAVESTPTIFTSADVNALGAFHTDATTVTLNGNVTLPENANGFGISYDVISEDGNTIYTAGVGTIASPLLSSGDIRVPEGKFFVIKPASTRSIGTSLGFLRLSGPGSTTVWSANGDAPNSTTFNSFAAGTYLHEGTLIVTHNNSLGEGHVKLRGGSTLRSQASVAIGEKKMDGTSLLADQHILLRPRSIDSTGLGDLTARSMSNVTFDVISNAKLAVHSRIQADLTNPTHTAIPASSGRVGIIKMGPGPMDVFAEWGARHTDGTHVQAGSLSSIPTGNIRYVGPLGFEYMTTPDSAKGVWRGVVNSSYPLTFRNTMNIEKDASVTVNRDQIFGDFKGSGTFNTSEYTVAEGGTNKNVFPTIVFRANARDRFATAIENESSLFDGLLNGNMDIVVDAPVATLLLDGTTIQNNTASTKGGQVVYLANENNNIPKGDTAIVNGVLAVKGTKSIGPGTIYLGVRNVNDNTTTAGERDTKGTNNNFFYGEKGTGTQEVPTLMGSGSVEFPVTQLVRIDTDRNDDADGIVPGSRTLDPTSNDVPELSAHRAGANANVANLAAVRSTTLSIASLDIVNLPLTVNHDFAAMDNSESLIPRYSSGTVKIADQYVIRGIARHQIAVERGVLHLEKLPITSAKDAGYMNVGIRGGAALSLGSDARDFSKLMDFVVDRDDSRIRVLVKSTDIAATENDALASTAIFRADKGDFRNLGTGDKHKDNRLVIQLDLTPVSDMIKAGSWIKVMTLRDTQGWNALHYLREGSGGAPEDYIKIDIATPEDVSYSRAGKVDALLSQNGYDVLVRVTQDLSPIERKGHINLSAIGGVNTVTANVTAADKDGGVVASADVTITVAGKTETAKTGSDGKATVTFSGIAAGTHDVTAKMDGFADETKQVTVTGGSTSGGSSGCNAGLGLGSLLLVAGGAVALRKKD